MLSNSSSIKQSNKTNRGYNSSLLTSSPTKDPSHPRNPLLNPRGEDPSNTKERGEAVVEPKSLHNEEKCNQLIILPLKGRNICFPKKLSPPWKTIYYDASCLWISFSTSPFPRCIIACNFITLNNNENFKFQV